MKNGFKQLSGRDIQVTREMREQWRAEDEEARRQRLTPPEGTALLPKQPPVSTEDATRSLACALAKWAVTAAKSEGQV